MLPMAKRRCAYGRRKNGRCPSRSAGLGGVYYTCTRYKKHNGIMRCAAYIDQSGVPPYRGQRKKFAEGTARNRRNARGHVSF